MLQLKGIPLEVIAQIYAQWYMKTLPKAAQDNYFATRDPRVKKILAGGDEKQPFPPSAAHAYMTADVPLLLQKMIFAALMEHWEQYKTQCKEEHKELDITAMRYVRSMLYLRRRFLRSAVFIQRDYPNHPVFKHPVFHVVEWKTFSASVLRDFGCMVPAMASSFDWGYRGSLDRCRRKFGRS